MLYDLLRAGKGLIWDGGHERVKSTVYNTAQPSGSNFIYPLEHTTNIKLNLLGALQSLYITQATQQSTSLIDCSIDWSSINQSIKKQSTSVICNKKQTYLFKSTLTTKTTSTAPLKKQTHQHSQTHVCQPNQLLSLNNNCLQIPRHISIISSFCLSIFTITQIPQWAT